MAVRTFESVHTVWSLCITVGTSYIATYVHGVAICASGNKLCVCGRVCITLANYNAVKAAICTHLLHA